MIIRSAPGEPTIPEHPKIIRRVYKGEVEEVDQSRRTVTATITTDAIDRYDEVIVAKGIKLDNFRANPVVLWCHCAGTVIGKNLWIKRYTKDGRSGLIAKTLFAKTDTADEVFQLYVEGFLNGWSIGANVDWEACSRPTDEEIQARPELKKCRAMYRKTELCEYSAVSIPANPEALGNEIGKAISADLRREIEQAERWEPRGEPAIKPTVVEPPTIELPRLAGRTFGQALAETRAMVARMTTPEAARIAAQDTMDRAKGRV